MMNIHVDHFVTENVQKDKFIGFKNSLFYSMSNWDIIRAKVVVTSTEQDVFNQITIFTCHVLEPKLYPPQSII